MTTLKAFLVPTKRTQKNKCDIVKYLGVVPDAYGIGELSVAAFATSAEYWQAMQLVVCDVEAEVKEGDSYYDTLRDEIGEIMNPRKAVDMFPKIIASHPNIPNTAPLPEAFIREYVKCQGNCTVQYAEEWVCCGIKVNGGFSSPDCCMKGVASTKLDESGNPILKCVPTTTVIDEETGENVLKGRRISADMLNGLDKAINAWSDADMEMAWKSASPDWGIIEAANFFNWLTEYKKSKK